MAFWTSLRSAKVTHDGRLLELAGGTAFLGSYDKGGKLFVRTHYEQLWAIVQQLVEAGTARRILVTGNPGTGKSCFGLYVLMQLALAGTTVIWQRSCSGERYLFRENTVVVGKLDSFMHELHDTTAWYVVPRSQTVCCRISDL